MRRSLDYWLDRLDNDELDAVALGDVYHDLKARKGTSKKLAAAWSKLIRHPGVFQLQTWMDREYQARVGLENPYFPAKVLVEPDSIWVMLANLHRSLLEDRLVVYTEDPSSDHPAASQFLLLFRDDYRELSGMNPPYEAEEMHNKLWIIRLVGQLGKQGIAGIARHLRALHMAQSSPLATDELRAIKSPFAQVLP